MRHKTHSYLAFDHIPWRLSIGLTTVIILFTVAGLMPRHTVGAEDPVWSVISALSFCLAGLCAVCHMVLARRIQFTFDRQANRIILHRRSMLVSKTSCHDLSLLQEVRLEQRLTGNGNSLYRPVLIMQSNGPDTPFERRIPLIDDFTNGPGPEALSETINTWLGNARLA